MKIYKDNITDRNEALEKLVVKSQIEMKRYLIQYLLNRGKNKVSIGDGYIFYKGKFPILLCAHMDTVHEDRISTLVYANGTLSSPQGIGGDDRCGIYMIQKILSRFDCSVVFLEDEEIGCIGAKKFAKTKTCLDLKDKLKYIIEFDRKGNNHAVTYDCENPEFDAYITKEFFKKEYGTCSDISYIAPALGVAAVNFSCGYYQEHHLEEWINLKEMETIIAEAIKLLNRTRTLEKPFEYIECKKSYYGYGNSKFDRYSWYDEDDYCDYYYNGYHNYNKTEKTLLITYQYSDSVELTAESKGETYADAMADFFLGHAFVKFEHIKKVVEK